MQSDKSRAHRKKIGEIEDEVAAEAKYAEEIRGTEFEMFGDKQRTQRRHPLEFSNDGYWLGPMDQVCIMMMAILL